MTPSRIPRLSDLVLLWLEEKIGKGHNVQYVGKRTRSYLDLSDYKLRIDGVVIGWLYDSYFELCGGSSESAGKNLFPEDPEFFDKLWAHMEKMSEDFDPLYQQKLTTYLKGKNE